jgi:NAD(P)-dependent dehydrogenase (short-subunit alcohol dehydrogenase family)
MNMTHEGERIAALDGKVAVVTGAGSGLGRGSALALARAGASVVMNDVDAGGLRESEAAILAAGGIAVAQVGDVRRTADVVALVARAVTEFGGLDVMHANAGVERYVELEHTDEEDMDLLLDVDLKGALLCAQHAISAMRRRGGGSIVYAAAKAGVIAAARTLALEVGGDGIRVNAISPGTIDTPMLTRDLADMDVAGAEEFLGSVQAANALGRIGRPDEIGDLVVYLASDRSSYITAANIVIDGGFTAVKRF